MRPRHGTVLIITLWIVMVLAGLVLVFARSMRVEAITSANEVASLQAAAVERGAEQYVLALVDQQQDLALLMPEESFQAVNVGEGYFWIVRPNYGEPDLPLFGLVDEASKVNLNTAPLEMLEMLPGMTEDLANGIIDWRDTDEDVSPGGAESEYYMSLPRPYQCKNSDFETVEELLLVYGCDRQILYGDAGAISKAGPGSLDSSGAPMSGNMPGGMNRGMGGGMLGMGRNQGNVSGLTTDWSLTHGLFDYVTAYSAEPGASTGTTTGAAPAGGNTRVGGAGLMSSRGGGLMNTGGGLMAGGGGMYGGATPGAGTGAAADGSTATQQSLTPGKINVNTAPREVLLCIPGLDETDVETIMAQRVGAQTEALNSGQTTNWLQQALPDKYDSIQNYVTTQAYRYSADIVAVSANGRAYKRVRIVVDATVSPPRIMYRKDITAQGWPLDPELLASMRNGSFDPSMAVTTTGGLR